MTIQTDIEHKIQNTLINLLKPLNVKISRLSQGLPVGGQLEYIDEATLEKSFLERVEINIGERANTFVNILADNLYHQDFLIL